MKKKILILIGPSAVGKTTFAKFLETRGFKEIISITTRSPRANEKNGSSYFFWDEEQFIQAVQQSRMIEYAEYCGNYYGNEVTLLTSQVEENHKNGLQSVIILELQGAVNLKKWVSENSDTIDIECVTAFFYVSADEQKRRLVDRLIDELKTKPADQSRRQIETFFDRAKNSDSEFEWSSHPTIDLLLSGAEGHEDHNFQMIKSVMEK